uniref:Zona pellucida sperm-binding protein 3 n=1 Tax=Chelonoidis abingdonii TaxID=106734 RepID=A0A8C0IZ30_CHEAB
PQLLPLAEGYKGPRAPRAASLLQPVMLQCEAAQMVITGHRDLFGMGRLIKAAELSLGPAACWYTSLNAAENTVIFVAGLHECGSTLQMTPDSLVYSTRLNYNPTPDSNPVILRTDHMTEVCSSHRKDNVSSKAIKPTWVPFSSTLSAEERLGFSLCLMNDDWSAERPSNGFQLGEVMHIQADVSTGNHVALRFFADSCVATLTPDRDSSPHYAVIDFSGCLVDGKSDDTTSAFMSPRQDTLQFMVDVFRFAGDIYITCHLKVTAVEQAPDSLNKGCSFNKAGNIWLPVEGTRNICRCCETGNCGLLGRHSRRAKSLNRWPGEHFQRHVVSRHGKFYFIHSTWKGVWSHVGCHLGLGFGLVAVAAAAAPPPLGLGLLLLLGGCPAAPSSSPSEYLPPCVQPAHPASPALCPLVPCCSQGSNPASMRGAAGTYTCAHPRVTRQQVWKNWDEGEG